MDNEEFEELLRRSDQSFNLGMSLARRGMELSQESVRLSGHAQQKFEDAIRAIDDGKLLRFLRLYFEGLCLRRKANHLLRKTGRLLKTSEKAVETNTAFRGILKKELED